MHVFIYFYLYLIINSVECPSGVAFSEYTITASPLCVDVLTLSLYIFRPRGAIGRSRSCSRVGYFNFDQGSIRKVQNKTVTAEEYGSKYNLTTQENIYSLNEQCLSRTLHIQPVHCKQCTLVLKEGQMANQAQWIPGAQRTKCFELSKKKSRNSLCIDSTFI